MALLSSQFTIGTTAVKVVSASGNPQQVILHNHSHATGAIDFLVPLPIFIGGANVTVQNGMHLDDNRELVMMLSAGDEVFAISNGLSRSLHVLARVL